MGNASSKMERLEVLGGGNSRCLHVRPSKDLLSTGRLWDVLPLLSTSALWVLCVNWGWGDC